MSSKRNAAEHAANEMRESRRQRTKISTPAKELAARTEDAFSSGSFTSWAAVAQLLLERGYNEVEAEEIMRSRWARHAADKSPSAKAAPALMVEWLDSSFSSRIEEHRNVFAMMQYSERKIILRDSPVAPATQEVQAMSYRDMISLIALNDDPSNMVTDAVAESMTVQTAADIYHVPAISIAMDIVRFRKSEAAR